MNLIFALMTETCVSCGAHNRWWVSRLETLSDIKYINWMETGLCPKCHDPKEPA